MNDFLTTIKKLTIKDLDAGHGREFLLRNVMEELGEYCAAVTVEQGIKKKKLKESARQEAIDLIICSLALFYLEGGEDEELV